MPDTAANHLLTLSARVRTLTPSATLRMVARVRALQAQGVDIIDLTAGEPDCGPPAAAEAAGIAAIKAGHGRYTAASGTPELRAAAARLAERETGVPYSAEETLVTSGAKLGICQALMALLNAGDEVLYPVPCWTSYPEMVKLTGGKPVGVACDENHLPTMAALEAGRSERSKVLLLNTPCNPTGAVYPEGLLKQIGEWAIQHRIAVISDEIYSALTYHGAKHISPMKAVPALREQAVWIGGMSKTYAMTGWRIGFMAGPAPLIKSIGALQSQLASSPNAISQLASIAALEQGDEELKQMRDAFETRCTLVADALASMDGVNCPRPQGAFYAFPSFSSYIGKTDPDTGRHIGSGDELAEVLLEADHVAVMGGSAFGAPEAIRISFAASDEQLSQAMTRLQKRLERLS
ncbi:MAG: aspartate aminotransferase [Planctomycetota bacterium]|nr:MAG: aspartate aminotransferase [Planctomycetota bacterium]